MPCRDQRVRRRRGGQVLVIAILAMTLLVLAARSRAKKRPNK